MEPTPPTSRPSGDLDCADTLWQAADKLRGTVDAAEYKHIVLGLLFLKYVSDAHGAENGFRVPPESRWVNLRAQAGHPDIAHLIDEAFLAIERDNPTLVNKLPRDYARRAIPYERLGGLIDLISGIGFKGDQVLARDLLGRVYEYFLGKFAAAEGKLGGEFYTPRCVVRLLVEMLEPYSGRVYDPCCGSGGMFVQSERFVEAHGGRQTDISLFGQESNPTTWRLAHMNLAIRGLEANLGRQPADTFLCDLHPDLEADYILANPPFNVSDWRGAQVRADSRWQRGFPPVGNANYAWIQHMAHHLSPRGRAGFVLANGSLSSNQKSELAIRKRLIADDLIDCVVYLPPQLFYTTQIAVSLWFLARQKAGATRAATARKRNRRGRTLFIHAYRMGQMVTRTLRQLTDQEIEEIAGTYRAWRGRPGERPYRDMPGFCHEATTEEIVQHRHALVPGRYVGFPEQEVLPLDLAAFRQELASLTGRVAQAEEALARVSDLLQELLPHGGPPV
jgi:type I restriction enzyme M protein